MSSRLKWTSVLLIVMSVWALPAFAQRTTATIRGTVTDPEGDGLPGVSVTITAVDSGFTRTNVTNADGSYQFISVPVGTYDLEAVLDGFSPYRLESIKLNVSDIREINASLQIGDVTEQVLVVADAIPVETMSGEVAGVIEGEQIRDLPLNGRNFTQLTQLMPGVSAVDGFDPKNKGLLSGVDISVSGGGVTGNLWTVDGVNNNDVGSNRTIMIYPGLEGIEEFKIHRNSYGAEFGGASGAQINLVTKSGSNEWHGSGFFSLRDDSLNSKNFFLEQADREKEPLDRKDFGYSFGGPIVENELYFFGTQEWNRENRGVVRTGFVPTAGERVGNFNDRVPGCSPPIPNDPLTGQPFPGNVIPDDRLSPAGLSFLELYPLPNTALLPGTCINWITAQETPINFRQESLRLDWDASDRARLMVRYTQDSWVNGNETQPNAGESNGLWGDDPFPNVDSAWDQPARSVTVRLNQEIGETGNNTLQFSYSGNRIDITRSGDNALVSRINSLLPPVFPNSDKTGGADRSHPVFWGAQGYAPLWNIAPWNNDQDLLVFKDDYTQVFGDHFVKAGVTVGINAKQENIGGASAFESPQLWGGAGINGWGATSGNVIADFLIRDMTHGFFENSSQPDPRLKWRDLEFYLSDSWQTSDTLTLDYGVRVSRLSAPFDDADRIANWSPDFFDPALGNSPCNGLIEVPGNNDCAEAGFAGSVEGPNRSLVENQWLFAPRLGLAWDVFGTGRSALRMGVGRFYLRDRVNIQLEMAGNPPFIQQASGIRRLDDAQDPCGFCFATFGGVPSVGMALENKQPHNWQWNVTWEQRLGRDTTIEIGYVGSKGVNLTRRSDINQVPLGDQNGNGIADRLEYARSTAGAGGALRPFGAFGDTGILFWEHNGESTYHSLQTQFMHRFSRGSLFQVSYTLSRMTANDPLTDAGAGTFAGQITDRDRLELDDGLAEIDRTHVLNASLVMALPELDDTGGLIQALFGDWRLGTILFAQSGTPITVYTGSVPGLNGGGPSGTGFTDNQRPSRVAGVSCTLDGRPDQGYLNPDAFTLDGFEIGTIGNAERGACRGPGFFQLDLSLDKNVSFGDGVLGLVRLEVFNVFNTDNFVGVNNILGTDSVTLDGPVGEATQIVEHTPSSSFGKAFGVRDPRQIQLGIRIEF